MNNYDKDRCVGIEIYNDDDELSSDEIYLTTDEYESFGFFIDYSLNMKMKNVKVSSRHFLDGFYND